LVLLLYQVLLAEERRKIYIGTVRFTVQWRQNSAGYTGTGQFTVQWHLTALSTSAVHRLQSTNCSPQTDRLNQMLTFIIFKTKWRGTK
jgi:hypothetical protein